MCLTSRSTGVSAGTEGIAIDFCTDTLAELNLIHELSEACPNKQELEQRLVEILHRISGADPASITPDALLMDDVGIDSLGFYEILIEADTCFGIRIKEEELLKFRTVADILQHLESLKIQLPNAESA